MIEVELGHQQEAMLWNGSRTRQTGCLSSIPATNIALWPVHKAQVVCSVLQRKTFANKLAASHRVQEFKFKRLSSIYKRSSPSGTVCACSLPFCTLSLSLSESFVLQEGFLALLRCSKISGLKRKGWEQCDLLQLNYVIVSYEFVAPVG